MGARRLTKTPEGEGEACVGNVIERLLRGAASCARTSCSSLASSAAASSSSAVTWAPWESGAHFRCAHPVGRAGVNDGWVTFDHNTSRPTRIAAQCTHL